MEELILHEGIYLYTPGKTRFHNGYSRIIENKYQKLYSLNIINCLPSSRQILIFGQCTRSYNAFPLNISHPPTFSQPVGLSSFLNRNHWKK